ncbi:ankyrin repeat-containing protein At5g02620-like [Macadamia integrifolia]|uniref:ankyrin repeat-containing protein At5g02620-like n=1 Tax=Macadamia integrifolia TaxID=60698 RepID=UPI001C4F9BEE|nr:ankyrin repeat-containing protein At5g02620-like [Macadamia integrifolia]
MDPQLYRAAKVGDVILLRQVVTGDSSRLLRVTPKGNTALHVSVSFGHIDFIQEVYAALLEHNTGLEGDTDYGRRLSLLTQVNLVGDTALHVAIREGHTSIAKFLIEKILPWPFEDHDVENGNSSLAREMIRMRNKSKNTALHEALRRYDLEMVELLIEADPHDLGHPNYDADAEGGESPLYLAARDGRLDIVNKILDICPSAAHSGPHGRTALHVAIVEVHLDVVEVLLVKKGELADKIDENGRTALHYAMSLERSHKIVQQLLSHDTSSVYKVDKDGLSSLHIAALNSSIEVFRELIECCPDFGELQDTNRRNVLHYAVMSKDLDKIKFAFEQLEREEFINQPDEDGNTPFHLLAEQGSIKLMEPFISNVRVDTMARNKNGQTVDEIFLNTIPIVEGLSSFIKALHMQRFFNQLALKTSLMPPSSIRGEEKWIIRVTNEKRIHTNLDKQAEEVSSSSSSNTTTKISRKE